MKTLLFKVVLFTFISLVSVKSAFAQSPPFVSFTSPTMGSSVVAGSTLDLGVTIASGVGISYVTYSADGSFLCVDTTAPYTCPWQVPTALGVGHTLQARVVDNLGANTYAFSFVGTIADTVAPVVSITNPSNGSNLAVGSSLLISANSSDNVGVTSVEFYVDGSLLCTDTSAPYSCVWSVPNTLSSHTLTAKSYDTSSNMSQASVSVNSVDTVAPVVNFTYPTNGGMIPKNTTITMTATATDSLSVADVKFYVNGVLKCTDTVAPYSCDWFVPKQKNITYTFNAKATDTSGNIGEKTVSAKSY